MNVNYCSLVSMSAAALLSLNTFASDAHPFRDQLKTVPFKIAYESYVDNNWEIFVMNADGSDPVNLTKTPEQEHYPQISPDGSRICYTVDVGEGRDTVRSLWIMDTDGKNRKQL